MKMWYMYKMEFYLALKKKIKKISGKWVVLDNIILVEVAKAQKDKHHSYT